MPYFLPPAAPSALLDTPAIDSAWREFLNVCPAMIWISDRQGHLLHVNTAWSLATGLDEITGSPEKIRSLVHPADRAAFSNPPPDYEKPFTWEFRLRHADGSFRWIQESVRPWHHADGRVLGYIGSAIDIHVQKEHEHRLTVIALRQTALTEFSRMVLEERTIGELSREALRLFQETLSLPAALLLLKTEDDPAMCVVAAEGMDLAALPSYKGSCGPAHAILELPENAALFPLALPQLEELGWHGGFAVPIHPDQPETGYFIGLYPAVTATDQRSLHHARNLAGLLVIALQRERSRHQFAAGTERARQARKSEEVRHFAGRTAHTLNNLLTPVICAADLLREEIADEDQLAKLGDILEASLRASQLIRQLQAVSRLEIEPPSAPPSPR